MKALRITIAILVLAAVALACPPVGPAKAQTDDRAAATVFPFVLPWDDDSETLTDISAWNERPAGRNGFIRSQDGHFYSGSKRIKFLGANMTMGANFPDSSSARKVAARMAKFGINFIRIHHLDWAQTPVGIMEDDHLTFSEDRLDRLDFFVSEMKKNGIYIGLGLHVSREYPGFPTWDDMPSFYKGIDHFYPDMIEMQKDYATTLLNHRNSYTGKRYKDDPAVAMIEINNEDSLILSWWKGLLDGMPEIFQAELERQYAQWQASRSGGPMAAGARRPMVKSFDFPILDRQTQDDWLNFLYYVEEKYFLEMRDFLKNELGAQPLIMGTHVGYSLASIQRQMDLIAANAYWQHPHFPGVMWDPANWYVPNYAMAGDWSGGTVRTLASFRVVGMPFMVTEYSHSAPNTYGTEGLLLAAAYGALQDWDGILAYEYSSRLDDWDPQYFTNYFSIDSHPAKMATYLAAAAMFLRGDVQTTPELAVVNTTKEAILEVTRTEGPQNANTDYLGLSALNGFYHRIGLSFDSAASAGESYRPVGFLGELKHRLGRIIGRGYEFVSTTNEVVWLGGDPVGVVTVNTPKSKTFVGACQGRTFDFDGILIKPSSDLQDWATVSLTVMEGEGFSGPARVLLTTTGFSENTDMGWLDAAKSSVGANWGRAPSRIEGIRAEITLPLAPESVRVWSLDGRGERAQEVPVSDAGGLAYFEIGPQYQTLWYEVVIN